MSRKEKKCPICGEQLFFRKGYYSCRTEPCEYIAYYPVNNLVTKRVNTLKARVEELEAVIRDYNNYDLFADNSVEEINRIADKFSELVPSDKANERARGEE